MPVQFPGASLGGNTFTGQEISQGLTGTSPGWYAQITGDSVPRVRIGLNASDVASAAFGSGSGARDLFLERAGAAELRFGTGAVDTGPVAQSLSMQNTLAGGTSNVAGADFTIKGSQGKGTGAGGSIIFQTAAAGGSGTTVNALATALTIDSTKLATFAGAATVAGLLTASAGLTVANSQATTIGSGGMVIAGRIGFNQAATGDVVTNSAGRIGFVSSTDPTQAPDTYFSRFGAGVMQSNGAFYANAATPFGTKTTATNGAAAQVATMTNGPAAGNPTKWMPFDDNGTTRYVPMW